FLTKLAGQGTKTIMISGNHDSPERIGFGADLLCKQGVHIGAVVKKELDRAVFKEDGIETEFVLLPFVKPAWLGVRNSGEAVSLLLSAYWQEEARRGYGDGKMPGGMQAGAGDGAEPEDRAETAGKKNRVLVTHFFVTDGGREPELSDSESTIHVGGLDNVDAGLFEGFDYVALGHIHKSQQIGGRPVWYAGAPLKYSFGETAQTKAVLLVETGREGLKEVRKLEIRPLREMRKVKGTLKEILDGADGAMGQGGQDYIQAILTDRGELIDPIGTIRSVYPNVMQIVREEPDSSFRLNKDGGNQSRILAEKKDTLALFEAFYQEVRDNDLSVEGKKALVDIVKELEG
ncbi:MAG: exonuclease SbcCD subunit D C-terminal domain-containing protein, partial [Lachnospiraceae bacterium]|nr:exonuclease SbcCD subunit D C-terminal domain-containing protein [Lachnospiraceae bacterium]